MRNISLCCVVFAFIATACVAGDIETDLSEVKAVGFSPDGKTVAYASFKDVHIWDLEKQEESKKLEGIGGDIYGLAFAKKGELLVAVAGEHALVWKVESGKLVNKIELKDYASHIAVSEKGDLFITGGKTAKVWDISSGKKKAELEGPKNRVVAVAIAPDESVIATGNEWLKQVNIWHPRGKLSREIEMEQAAEGLAFSPDGNTIAVAGRSQVSVINRDGAVTTAFDLPGCRGALDFSPDGKLIAAGTWRSTGDESVVVYSLSEKKIVNTIGNLPKPIYQVVFSPDGKMLAIVAKDKVVRLRSVSN